METLGTLQCPQKLGQVQPPLVPSTGLLHLKRFLTWHRAATCHPSTQRVGGTEKLAWAHDTSLKTKQNETKPQSLLELGKGVGGAGSQEGYEDTQLPGARDPTKPACT